MDLMFAAQAQAAAVAAAQYYNAAISAAGGQPSAPPGSVVNVTSPQHLHAPPPGVPMPFPPTPPVLSGTPVLGAQFLVQQQPPQIPQHKEHSSKFSNNGCRDNDFDNELHRDETTFSSRDRKERHRADKGRDRRGRSRSKESRDRRSRSRDRESRRSRSRSRSRERSRRRDHRDRSSPPRRERNRSRDRESSRRDRDRDREHRSDRDRDRDRRDRTPESDEEARNVPPNNTIMVRGLAQHITETDISDDIQGCGLSAKDIRLIRKKETGASRGFAFVEFAKIQDAQKWMDEKKGILMFKDQYRAVMQYSLPRDGRPGEPPRILHDWICSNCGVQNFRRRDQCFKCGGPKTDIDAGEGADEVSPHPTSTVLLRGLDALTTEDAILNSLMQLTNLPLKSVKVGRDSLTNTSRGICYVEMNSVVDAMFLHNQLLGEPPTIDDKLVSVSYFRPPLNSSSNQSSYGSSGPSNRDSQPTAAANAALAAAQWSHQGRQGIASQYGHDDIERMAEYSASLYAKTASEKAHYLEYYRNYYKNGGGKEDLKEGSSESSKPQTPVVPVKKDQGKVNVNGVEYPRYPTPDVSTYSYDESSGYYYDSTTQLYYDSGSQYYFDSKTSKYVYWSPEHHTFLPAPDQEEKKQPEEEKKKEDKKDKVKTAKRIAKDMEKWAKTLNQKSKGQPAPQQTAPGSGGSSLAHSVTIGKSTEDLAFSMLQNKKDDNESTPSASSLSKLSGYGSDSGPEDQPSESTNSNSASAGAEVVNLDEQQFTDWSKLACLLCKRQFPSREKLTKHNEKSDLHRSNLESWRAEQTQKQQQRESSSSCNQSFGSADFGSASRYRDRAKERRQKYGIDDEGPKPNRLKEKYLAAMEHAEIAEQRDQKPKKLDSSNIGSKMLQRMGWKEGLGLGKTNQGRTSIIEADGRNSQAGLGSATQKAAKSNPNESYKDSVKRTLFQRYHQLE